MTRKSSPRILLVYPSCFRYPGWMERLEIRTSLLWLASFLHRFYPVQFADFEIEIGRPGSDVQIRRFERKVREYLAGQEFDILAISCWTSLSYQASVVTARVCREVNPTAAIVVGGYHPSARPDDFMTDERLFDYVVLREGELALKEIADEYGSAGRPAQPRVVVGRTVAHDDFVGYDWELIEAHVQRHFPRGIDNFFIYLSRGCPFGCSFCMEPTKERSWRAFSPEEAIRQVSEAVRRFRVGCVAISDACFGMRPGWRKEFLRRLSDLDPSFWIIFETRPEYLDREDVDLLAGKKVEIQFGVESCSPDMLRIMKKTKQPEKFLQHFADISTYLSDRQVLHRANLIFNHPGETRRTLAETFAFMDRLLVRSDSYLMWAAHGFMHFPGCDTDVNHGLYERQYGSRFLSGDWWRGNEDQYEASMKFVPSTDLDGRQVGLWKEMLETRQERMKAALAPYAFDFAARKYFDEWQKDARFSGR